MSRKIIEQIDDFMVLWKRLWDLCYPFAFSSIAVPPTRDDEEELVILKSRILEKFPALAPFFHRYEYPAAQAFQRIMDSTPSLLQMLQDVSLRERFRKNWNEMHQYLHLLKGDVTSEAEHPFRRWAKILSKPKSMGRVLLIFLLIFLAMWKILDLFAAWFPEILKLYILK